VRRRPTKKGRGRSLIGRALMNLADSIVGPSDGEAETDGRSRKGVREGGATAKYTLWCPQQGGRATTQVGSREIGTDLAGGQRSASRKVIRLREVMDNWAKEKTKKRRTGTGAEQLA